jgi:hypothetical protein
MPLLDLFRSQPEWKHADPEVRAAAVRRLAASEQELVLSLAREDADARVRKAALRRLTSVPALRAIATEDSDEGVRREALESLHEFALRADPEAALGALEALRDPKALAAVVQKAALPEVRQGALERLEDARALASLARGGTNDPALQLAALARIQDHALLYDLASKCEHKAVALAATDRLESDEHLRGVAERARQRAAARRAAARLAERQPAPASAEPLPVTAPAALVDPAEEQRLWEAAQATERARVAEGERRLAEQERAHALREDLLRTLEQGDVAQADLASVLDKARADWAALPPIGDPAPFDERFARALLAFEERGRRHDEIVAQRPLVDALLTEAESALALEDVRAAQVEFDKLERRFAEFQAADVPEHAQHERFTALRTRARARRQESRAVREQQATTSRERLTSLCVALEELAAAEAPALRDAEARLRATRQALEEPHAALAKTERDALFERLKAARAALAPKVQAWRQDAEWKRWASAELREDLVRRVEALGDASDLERADRQLHELETQWRRALSGAREVAPELVARWNAAQAPLRARCDAAQRERQAEYEENLRKKEALVLRAEALSASSEWLKTAEELQKLQNEWKTIGPVPPRHAKGIWERFRKPCDEFFTRRKADLDQRKQTWHQNLERKQALIARAEELAQSHDWDAAAAEIKRLQAEWKATGPVRKNHSEVVWQRFRAACDQFFARYKQRDQLAAEAAVGTRDAWLTEAESWLPGAAGAAPEDLAQRLATLQTRWRQTRASGPAAAAQEQRLQRVRRALVAAYPEAFRGTDLDPDTLRKRREKLLERAEALAAQVGASGAMPAGTSVADQLRKALAKNALGGKAAAEARARAWQEELDQVRAAWERLLAPAGEEADFLAERFEAACERTAQALPRGAR